MQYLVGVSLLYDLASTVEKIFGEWSQVTSHIAWRTITSSLISHRSSRSSWQFFLLEMVLLLRCSIRTVTHFNVTTHSSRVVVKNRIFLSPYNRKSIDPVHVEWMRIGSNYILFSKLLTDATHWMFFSFERFETLFVFFAVRERVYLRNKYKNDLLTKPS